MVEVKEMKEVMPEKEALYPGMDRVKSEDLIGKTFVIKEATELDGEHGKFYVALIELDGKDVSTAFGSKVVNSRITDIKDKLPVRATLVEKKSKEGRIYYTLE